MPESTEKQVVSRGQHSKLLLVVTGVMIPLLALSLPYLVELISPKAALVFESHGPIQVGSTKVFSLEVRNSGKSVEKNVEVWLPTKLDKEKSKVECSIPFTTRVDGNKTVVTLGDLRPNEKVDIAALVEESFSILSEYSLKSLRIVSTEHLAEWDGPSEEWDFIYRAGFWGFLLLLLFAITLGIYQEYFMSRPTREKLILKELDKLK